MGVPQKTKMKVTRTPTEKIQLRYYLKKRGYIIDEVTCTAYYTEETQRAKRIEAKQQRWYSFAPMPTTEK